MFKYIVQFLILYLLWNNNKKAKGGWLTSSSILLGLYTICSFFGIIELNIGDYKQPYDSYYWIPMLIFDFFLLAYLMPFRQFNETKIKKLVLPNRKFLDVFSVIIIVLSLYSIIFYSKSVVGVFTSGSLKELRDSNEIMFYEGVFDTIGSVASENYMFAIVLFFIYTIIGNSRKRCFLLLISSLSKPVHILAFVGRDGVVFWIFTFIFCYAFFRSYMNENLQKNILKSLLRFGIILLIPFFMISISRFGGGDYGGTGNSIISYLGHAFLQGPLYFGLEDKVINIGGGFPLFYEITGLEKPIASGIRNIGEWYSWKFATFITNLYMYLDLIGLIVVTILFYLLFHHVLTFNRSKKKMTFGQFTYYLFYFQIISQGVFYFRQYTRGGNLFIVTTMILALLFHLYVKSIKNPIIFNKIQN